MKTAEDILKDNCRRFVVLKTDTTLYEAAKVMVHNKIGSILVKKKKEIVGIWTERDLMHNIVEFETDLKTGLIHNYMTQRFGVIHSTASIYELLDSFRNSDIRHLVVERKGKYIGLLAVEDVIKTSLTEVSEDYRRLFEHVGCGVYISSKEGRFLNANKAFLDMMGYENKEEFFQIDIERDLYSRPEDRKKFQKMIEKDGHVINYEVDFRHRDGKKIPVLLTAHVRYDQHGNVLGYEGISVDQSETKTMENELREAHDFANEMIRSSPNAIIATDLDGNIIIWNRAAEKTLGYKAEDVVGKMRIERIYSNVTGREIAKMIASEKYGGVGMLRAYPIAYVRKDGGVVEGNLSVALIYDAKGKEVAYVGIFVDLEERLQMERKLRQTQEQLLQAEKLAAMGRLTSQVAHELNNPLYGIMNTFELLKTEIPPHNKRRKILDMALSETVRLANMLRKMLSFSKPDEEERQVTDINTVLDEILLLHEKQLREHSIKIVSTFAADLEKVYASRNQLRQVFLNIVSNARDAMPNGGTLTVETKMVHGKIHTTIEDTGVGITPENLDKIFDAFFTTKDKVKGVGLGLSVCHGFIRDHGGDIKVESEFGSGTTFNVILPAHVNIHPERPGWLEGSRIQGAKGSSDYR